MASVRYTGDDRGRERVAGSILDPIRNNTPAETSRSRGMNDSERGPGRQGAGKKLGQSFTPPVFTSSSSRAQRCIVGQ